MIDDFMEGDNLIKENDTDSMHQFFFVEQKDDSGLRDDSYHQNEVIFEGCMVMNIVLLRG